MQGKLISLHPLNGYGNSRMRYLELECQDIPGVLIRIADIVHESKCDQSPKSPDLCIQVIIVGICRVIERVEGSSLITESHDDRSCSLKGNFDKPGLPFIGIGTDVDEYFLGGEA